MRKFLMGAAALVLPASLIGTVGVGIAGAAQSVTVLGVGKAVQQYNQAPQTTTTADYTQQVDQAPAPVHNKYADCAAAPATPQSSTLSVASTTGFKAGDAVLVKDGTNASNPSGYAFVASVDSATQLKLVSGKGINQSLAGTLAKNKKSCTFLDPKVYGSGDVVVQINGGEYGGTALSGPLATLGAAGFVSGGKVGFGNVAHIAVSVSGLTGCILPATAGSAAAVDLSLCPISISDAATWANSDPTKVNHDTYKILGASKQLGNASTSAGTVVISALAPSETVNLALSGGYAGVNASIQATPSVTVGTATSSGSASLAIHSNCAPPTAGDNANGTVATNSFTGTAYADGDFAAVPDAAQTPIAFKSLFENGTNTVFADVIGLNAAGLPLNGGGTPPGVLLCAADLSLANPNGLDDHSVIAAASYNGGYLSANGNEALYFNRPTHSGSTISEIWGQLPYVSQTPLQIQNETVYLTIPSGMTVAGCTLTPASNTNVPAGATQDVAKSTCQAAYLKNGKWKTGNNRPGKVNTTIIISDNQARDYKVGDTLYAPSIDLTGVSGADSSHKLTLDHIAANITEGNLPVSISFAPADKSTAYVTAG